MLPPSVQWGTITLQFDHEEFQKGYVMGRASYFEDSTEEEPGRATPLTCLQAARTIVIGGDTSPFRFDEEELEYPLETLGVFLGYMSEPLFPETPEEQQRRLARSSLLPELALQEAL